MRCRQVLDFAASATVACNAVGGLIGGGVVVISPSPSLHPQPMRSYCDGEPGYYVGQLQHPRGVAVDEDGFVYVASTKNHMVHKF